MMWRAAVNQPQGVVRLADIHTYIAPAAAAGLSPIDVFYDQSRDILKAGTPAFLTTYPTLGPLLLVGLVSATENYFRDIFGRILQLCPIARASAADQPVKIGSVVWHGATDLERGAFEHLSFADADAILKASKKFINHDLRRTALLDEFDRVCELRHSVVHSSAVIAGKNAVRLQIRQSSTPLRVQVGFAELQESGAICTSLVAAVNLELFEAMARRWAVDWPKSPSWLPSERHQRFKAVWQSFYSTRDAAAGVIPAPLTLIKCRNCVEAEFR